MIVTISYDCMIILIGVASWIIEHATAVAEKSFGYGDNSEIKLH